MNYPKIFVINLKKSVDRKKHMEKVLSELPIKVEFVEAIDGKELSDEEIFQVYDEACKKNLSVSLTKGEIGCFLSHIKVWKKIKKQKLKEVFIMEDDIVIKDKKAFLEILKNRNCFPKNWEIVLFAHGCSRYTGQGNETSFLFYSFKIYKQYKLKRFLGPAAGTLGYLLNQKAVEKLLKKTSPKFKGTIDHFYTGNDRIINLYGIEPVIIEESNLIDTTMSDRYIAKNEIFFHTNPTIYTQIIDKIENFLKYFGLLSFFKKYIHHPIKRLLKSLSLEPL